MVVRILSIVLLSACRASHPVTVAEPVKTVESVPDGSRFPSTYPTLQEAERATDPLRAEKLARSALRELDEERELTSADAGTFARLQTRARIALDAALMTQGKPIEVLADLAQHPLECPAGPKLAHTACEELMASLATALPNAVTGRGRVAQIDSALVLDENTSEPAMTAFSKKVAEQVGIVVQRVHVTSKIKDTLEVTGTSRVRFHVVVAEANLVRVADGEIVWMAFDARSLRKAGPLWDAGKAHVLAVQPRMVSGL